jgi:hypothetical protein
MGRLDQGRISAGGRRGTPDETKEDIAGSILSGLRETGKDPSILDRGKNLLGRTFDILSRPNYAVAEATQDIIEGGNPVAGLIQGLTGQEKTTFSDVLETAGVENRFVRGVGGFALDIALDPTTYLAPGIVKGMTGSKIAAEAGRAGEAAMGTVKAQNEAWRVGRDLTRKIFGEAKVPLEIAGRKQLSFRGPGGKFMNQKKLANFAMEEGKLAEAEHLKEMGFAAAKEHGDKLAAENQGRVVLKFLGKEVAGSERAYKAGSKLAEVAKKRPAVRAINKAFRNEAKFVDGLNSLRRRAEMVNIGRYEAAVNRISKLFDGLTPEQSVQIVHAAENGIDLSAIGLQKKVEEVQEFFNIEHDLMWQAGIKDPMDELSNYVYQIFDPSKNDRLDLELWDKEYHADVAKKVAERKRIIAETGVDPGVPSTDFTLKRAIEERGLHPEMDIRDIIAGKLAKSYAAQGHKRFVDDAIGEFGVTLSDESMAKKMGLVKSEAKYAKDLNVYLPREIEDTLKHFDKYMADDESIKDLLKMYDKALSFIKFNQTVVNPGHHIRNLIGDAWNSFLDGVIDPDVYRRAARIQNRVKNFEGIDDYRDVGDIIKVQNSPSEKLKIGDFEFDEEQVYTNFLNAGNKSGFYDTEFSGLGENLGKTLAQKITKKARNISEGREDFVRLAHFIDAWKKEGINAKTFKEVDEAAQRAGARVRKFNFDYGDLTDFERRKLKRVIPYYTWMRKNIPLQIESLALRPGRQLVAPKGIKALETMLGTDTGDPTIGPLSIVPQWLRDSSAVTLSHAGNGLFWNPEVLPVYSMGEAFGYGDPMEIARGIAAQGSPFFRVPLEKMTNFSLYRGGPDTASNLDTVRDMTPVGRLLGRLAGGTLQPEHVSSWLSGISLSRPSDQMVRGELRRQEDIVQRILRDRGA